MLSCSCLLPDGWVNVPLPAETYERDQRIAALGGEDSAR